MRRLACLDLEHSTFKRFEHPPHNIMEVVRRVFHEEMMTDPLAFCIPEEFIFLFGTPAVVAELQRIGCHGIEYEKVA